VTAAHYAETEILLKFDSYNMQSLVFFCLACDNLTGLDKLTFS